MAKTTFGDPIDLSPWLKGEKKARNRTNLVGVELEGGWDEPPRGNNIIRDGSVRGLRNDFTGEIPSPALTIDQMRVWLEKCYPTSVNHTCGFHIHLSFKDALCYQRLMDNRFPATILAEFRKWGDEMQISEDHPLWNRLTNGTAHCRHTFDPDGQVTNTEKDYNQERPGNRYSVINYCWGRYQTVECRVLPMFATHQIAFEAVCHYIKIANAFLVAVAKREEKVLTNVVADHTPLKDLFIGGMMLDQGDRRDILLYDTV